MQRKSIWLKMQGVVCSNYVVRCHDNVCSCCCLQLLKPLHRWKHCFWTFRMWPNFVINLLDLADE